MKRLISILLAAILSVSFCACDSVENVLDAMDVPATPKTFTVENLTIELTDDFFRMDMLAQDFDFCISSEDIVIFGTCIDIAENELAGISSWDYATAFHDALEESTLTAVTDLNGIPSMQYNSYSDDGEKQTVFITVHETNTCFWLLQFIFDTEDYDRLYPLAQQYALSVKSKE